MSGKATIVGNRLVHFEIVYQISAKSRPIVHEVVGYKIEETDETVTIKYVHPVTHLPETIILLK